MNWGLLDYDSVLDSIHEAVHVVIDLNFGI